MLLPIHPNGHGGLGFLGLSPIGNAPVTFAAAAAISSNWWYRMLAQGTVLPLSRLEASVFLAIVLLIAISLLAFFVPRLARLRRQGTLDYGTLGRSHSMDFHVK